MLQSITLHLEFARKILSEEKISIVNGLIRDHIQRNFPKPQMMFDKWKETDKTVPSEFEANDPLDNLTLILDISNLYESLCPQLLDNILNNIDPISPTTLNDYETQDDVKKMNIIIKATNLFLNLNAHIFLPSQELFSYVFPMIYADYYQNKNIASKKTLMRLYKLTGIFEGNDTEMEVWINSIYSLKKFDHCVTEYISLATRDVATNILEYTSEFNEIKSSADNDVCMDFDNLLEALTGDIQNRMIKKQLHLSPLILGFLKNANANKYVKCYLNSALVNLLHVQVNPSVIIGVAKKYENAIGSNTLNYITSWRTGEIPQALDNFKSKLTVIEKISKGILLSEHEDITEEDVNVYFDGRSNLIYMCVFYITNLANTQKLEESHLESCLKMTKTLIRGDENHADKYIEIILSSSILLQYFDVHHKTGKNYKMYCTKYITELVKEFKCAHSLLVDVREKLYLSVKRVLNKPRKCKLEKHKLIDVLNIIGLHYSHCVDILRLLSSVDEEVYVNLAEVTLYTLKRFHSLCKEDRKLELLDKEIIDFLSRYLVHLNASETNTTAFANGLREYLEDFPHSLQYVHADLFQSILSKKEYCKENSLLARLLLTSSKLYLQHLSENIQNVCNSKGLILPLLEAAIIQNADNLILKEIYDNFEISLVKSLQKPQKAVAHFDVYYKSLVTLIEYFFPIDKCLPYVQKVQKYETTEIFHVNLLCAIFDKVLAEHMDEKHLNNCIVTLIHLGISLLKKKGKTEEDWNKIKLVSNAINDFLKKQIDRQITEYSFKQVNENETFQLYTKFCLKFGLSGNEYLLKLIETFCSFLNVNEEYASLLMDMIISHSDFLDVVLNDNKPGKVEVLNLMLVLCKSCPKIMQKNHIPILLASYRATWKTSDRIILSTLKL